MNFVSLILSGLSCLCSMPMTSYSGCLGLGRDLRTGRKNSTILPEKHWRIPHYTCRHWLSSRFPPSPCRWSPPLARQGCLSRPQTPCSRRSTKKLKISEIAHTWLSRIMISGCDAPGSRRRRRTAPGFPAASRPGRSLSCGSSWRAWRRSSRGSCTLRRRKGIFFNTAFPFKLAFLMPVNPSKTKTRISDCLLSGSSFGSTRGV